MFFSKFSSLRMHGEDVESGSRCPCQKNSKGISKSGEDVSASRPSLPLFSYSDYGASGITEEKRWYGILSKRFSTASGN